MAIIEEDTYLEENGSLLHHQHCQMVAYRCSNEHQMIGYKGFDNMGAMISTVNMIVSIIKQ